tara:strand:- start:1705 stop:2046 length:342 start_codon:yes stop_codon:yes gene_type:complete
MKLTEKYLNQIIKSELDLLLKENSRHLNSLERLFMEEEPELFQWYLDQNVDPYLLEKDERGYWNIIYNVVDDNIRTRNLPDGWYTETYAPGASDEDTNYIITKDEYPEFWWEQ